MKPVMPESVGLDGRQLRRIDRHLETRYLNRTMIPGARTLSGQNEVVRDGVFRFSRFELPAGVTMRFVGSNPARLLVRGEVVVRGRILVRAADQPVHPPFDRMGQAGGAGGPFGGSGGKGADKGDGQGNQPRFDGAVGSGPFKLRSALRAIVIDATDGEVGQAALGVAEWTGFKYTLK